MTVFIVMRWRETGVHEFQGVFSTPEKAEAACTMLFDCVRPAELDSSTGADTMTWPGAYYPRQGGNESPSAPTSSSNATSAYPIAP